MDVNGTRFHLIQGKAEWTACREEGRPQGLRLLSFGEASETITLTPLLTIFSRPSLGTALDPSMRRGAAADRFGSWYWIGIDRRSLYWLPHDKRQPRRIWPRQLSPRPKPPGSFGDTQPPLPDNMQFAGLTVTRQHYLVVGVTAPSGLLVFDLLSGGTPSFMTIPGAIPFLPFDLAPAPDGGFWVLDRTYRRYWRFDRDFRICADAAAPPGAPVEVPAFHAVGEIATSTPAAPAFSGFVVAAPDPIAIEGLPDGTVLILDGSAPAVPVGKNTVPSHVYCYRGSALVGNALPLEGTAEVEEVATGISHTLTVAVAAHDIAYNPDTHMLYAADCFGRQSVAFSLKLEPTPSLAIERNDLPMHAFGARALVGWGESGSYAVSYDVIGTPAKDQAVLWARLQTIDQSDFAAKAALLTPVFDGKDRDCVWDALFVDACIPSETAVRIWTRTHNDPALVETAPFNEEPHLYLRRNGAEVPYYEPFLGRADQDGELGTWEVLLQRARGRYLQIRLELSGNGRRTPAVTSLRVYYPRFSYAKRYLPAVYSEEPVSASFIERMLANPKGFYTDIEGRIRDVGILFDARSARAETLDWLAGWLGLAFDPMWEQINQRRQTGAKAKAAVADRRRLAIRYAMRLFMRRGTADGIRFALSLLLEPCLESMLQRLKEATLKPDSALGAELARLGLPQPVPNMSDIEIEDLLCAYLLSPRRPSKVRLVERFMTRGGRALVSGDPTQNEGSASGDSDSTSAHRFAVLVPETLSKDELAMVTRIVQREKPAHTAFEVRRYWDYFRVGEARLGLDTALGEDARFLAFILGQNTLADGYLANPPPMDATDRLVLDREPLGALPPL